MEETGLELDDVEFLTCTNTIWAEQNMHYVTVFMGALVNEASEPKVSSFSYFGESNAVKEYLDNQ
jgi:hypothetical protein